jgi:hypothetical protein
MKLKGSAAAGAVGFVIALGFLQCVLFYLVNPSLFGLSLGWKLDFPGRGWLFHEAFTPKTRDMESFYFYLREGEELHLDVEVEREEGWIFVAVYRKSGFASIDFLMSKVYQVSAQETHLLTAPRSGFYRVTVDLMRFEGVVRARWGS